MTKPSIDSLKSRFERKIWKDLATGCWNWTGGCDTRGYPRIRFGDTILYARHAAVLIYRKVPAAEKIRHTMSCGNQKCVNPDHVRVIQC